MAFHMNTKLQGAQAAIGYNFNDPMILWEALNVAGSPVVNAGNRNFPDGNKRLALFGDSVLKMSLIDDWYPTNMPRVMAQNILDTVAINSNLHAAGIQHEIGRYLNNNPCQRGAVSPATMATSIEAIIGAVHLDGDLAAVKQVLHTLGLF